MTYPEQLSQPQWMQKRLEILERDGSKCTMCNKERSVLRGLSKSFGTWSLDELLSQGYRLQTPSKEGLSFDSLTFSKDKEETTFYYVGDNQPPFHPSALKFGKAYRSGLVFGVLKTSAHFIAFYEEDVKQQGLTDLAIHHTCYINGRLAWEYNNDALITLCSACHKEIHQTTAIPVLSSDFVHLYDAVTCTKCGGSGHLEEYDYYMDGVCFQCSGEGVVLRNEGIDPMVGDLPF